MKKIPNSEITPENVYLNRRKFIRYAGFIVIAGAFYPIACKSDPLGNNDYTETVDKLTPFDLVTNFNSFFEFSPLKVGLGELSKNFSTSPWEVEITGLVKNPGTIDINDIKSRYPQEERVYRLRCVEAWSMVIPWLGFPLASFFSLNVRDSESEDALENAIVTIYQGDIDEVTWFEVRLTDAEGNCEFIIDPDLEGSL